MSPGSRSTASSPPGTRSSRRADATSSNCGYLPRNSTNSTGRSSGSSRSSMIPAATGRATLDASERLARIQHLLAGLPGPYGNEHLWAFIAYSDHDDPFADVYAFIAGSGVVDSVGAGG